MTDNGRHRLFCLIVVPALLSLQPIKAQFRLTDVTNQTGIDFTHTDGSFGQRYIVESVSAGLALFDYDNDGDIDIYFLNGRPLQANQSPTGNALYRNEGHFRFTNVTATAGVGDLGHGLGVAVGDYDNDGYADLYLNNFGPNVLYRNNGDSTFTNVTQSAGVANGDKVGAGASFLDIDRDGYLDLFVANYVEFSCADNVKRTVRGFPQHAGPLDYLPMPNTLYKNNGDGTFSDVTKSSGIANHLGTGMGLVSADYDNDGDPDILVANDLLGNFLFRNDGEGNFDEVGLQTGFAYDLNGSVQSSMGVDCADYDNDGHLDFFVTSYARELATLYRNLGNGTFEDVGLVAGASASVLPHVTWGTGFADYDNDGDRDIFIACGHIEDNIQLYDSTTTYRCPNVVLLNTGNGRFTDVSQHCGDGLQPVMSSRGIGLDDLDNDGDIDVVILNARQKPTILENQTENGNCWLKIDLVGTRSNRMAVGAKVKVVADKLAQISVVHSGRSYQSHYGQRLHFGLGRHLRIDTIEIIWPSGLHSIYRNIPANRNLVLQEGQTQVQYERQ